MTVVYREEISVVSVVIEIRAMPSGVYSVYREVISSMFRVVMSLVYREVITRPRKRS